jgi:hypothetical protein
VVLAQTEEGPADVLPLETMELQIAAGAAVALLHKHQTVLIAEVLEVQASSSSLRR